MSSDDGDSGGESNNTSPDSPENDHMTTISLHSFGDPSNANVGFTVQIIESMREEYGMYVWPSSVALAEYVWLHQSRFSGASVLEVLENIRKVCDLNNINCEVKGLTWGVWDAHIFDLHPQILLGADVLYDTRAFDDLFGTVTFLLQNTPGSVFITTYQNRSGHRLIEFLMFKWGLKCTKLVDAFSFMPCNKASGLGGNIQLAEIVLDNHRVPSSSMGS